MLHIYHVFLLNSECYFYTCSTTSWIRSYTDMSSAVKFSWMLCAMTEGYKEVCGSVGILYIFLPVVCEGFSNFHYFDIPLCITLAAGLLTKIVTSVTRILQLKM